jgi:hypothetical protein
VATKNNKPTITRNYNFDAIKQVSFDGVLAKDPPTTTVPEPAAWALMLVGFGGMGAMLRRRRAQVAFA